MVYSDYTSSFDELLKEDEAVTIHQRNIQLVAIEMFKVKNDIGPIIMKTLFKFNDRGNKLFHRPSVNTEYKEYYTLFWSCSLE